MLEAEEELGALARWLRSNPLVVVPIIVAEIQLNARGILAFMFHATCGSLMLPVVIYGWEASETYQDLFLLGSLLDLGWDLFSQIQVYLATFHGDVADRWGWARCPRGLFPFIVMHHALAYIIVVPMDNKYVHLSDYHQVCLSLLGAAACAMGINAVKMTLDVTKRSELLLFKALLTTESGIMLYTRGYLHTHSRGLLNCLTAGDVSVCRHGNVTNNWKWLDAPVLVPAGEKASFNCTYDLTGPLGRKITHGFAGSHEMCIAYLAVAVPESRSNGDIYFNDRSLASHGNYGPGGCWIQGGE